MYIEPQPKSYTIIQVYCKRVLYIYCIVISKEVNLSKYKTNEVTIIESGEHFTAKIVSTSPVENCFEIYLT